MVKTLALLICAVCLIAALPPCRAQDEVEIVPGTAIYVKQFESGDYQIVTRSGDTIAAVNVPNNLCWGVLAGGEYLALLERENPQTLQIIRPDGTPVQTVPWNDFWRTVCYHGWDERSIPVEIRLDCTYREFWANADYTYMQLDMTSGAISGPYSEVIENCDFGVASMSHGRDYRNGVSAPLPGFIPDDTVAASAAGRPDLYVYARCISGETLTNGWYDVEECRGPDETVLYDAAHEEVIEVLADFPDLSLDHRLNGVSWGLSRFAWSPSGRYLAYQAKTGLAANTIRVYDVDTHTFSPSILSPDGLEFVRQIMPNWSPDEQTIVLALIAYDGSYTPITFAAYDRATGDRMLFGPPQRFAWDSWRWSADSQSALFAMYGALSYWEVGQADYSVVDEDVNQILAWYTD